MAKLNKEEKNYNNYPLILFIVTFILLLLLQFIPENTSVAGYKTKEFNMFVDIKPDSLVNTTTPVDSNYENLK